MFKILFLIIQYNISHLNAHSLNVKEFHSTHNENSYLSGLGMAIKGYSIFSKAPGLEPHHPSFLCHIQDTLLWGLTPVHGSSQCILQHQRTGFFPFGGSTRKVNGFINVNKSSIYSKMKSNYRPEQCWLYYPVLSPNATFSHREKIDLSVKSQFLDRMR